MAQGLPTTDPPAGVLRPTSTAAAAVVRSFSAQTSQVFLTDARRQTLVKRLFSPNSSQAFFQYHAVKNSTDNFLRVISSN